MSRMSAWITTCIPILAIHTAEVALLAFEYGRNLVCEFA
ncbi:hypothetical protein Tsubulata_014512 [Turnera subulata]|uniref:Uncharacterized protein n=1 Tax=Turnera subulata TaxID=218843 RepID=A0A9Q0G3P3_9ROSI|nr:hypothetical protein Tsubulata_014512 [Turnera subulata]